MHKSLKARHQQGFTLIELLVVVAILATIASIANVVVDSYQQRAEEELVRVEMDRIASAIYRFQADTGYFPEEGIFKPEPKTEGDPEPEDVIENMDWLFRSPTKTEIPEGENEKLYKILPWNPATGRGWHGPYLTVASEQRYINSNSNGSCDQDYISLDDPYTSYTKDPKIADPNNVVALSDTFIRQHSYNNSDNCFAIYDKGNWRPQAAVGQPYQYQKNYKNHPLCKDEDKNGDGQPDKDGCLVLISAGPDSRFDTVDDNLVRVLRVNFVGNN